MRLSITRTSIFKTFLPAVSRKTTLIYFFMLVITTPCLYAQEQFNPDKMFAESRELAFRKEHKKARELLLLVLEKYPNYHDVRIFYANLLAWDKEFPASRLELNRVIEAKPQMVQAYLTLAQIELWDQKPAAALEVARKGNQQSPTNMDLWLLEAKALYKLHQREDAIYLARQIKRREPNHEGVAFLNDLLKEARINQVGVHYNYDTFDNTFDPWKQYSLDFSHRFSFGSVIGRVNQADRFNKNGTQYEIDAYPKIGKRMYLYLNAGYSGDRIFPDRRYGFELYKGFPHSIDASLGLRYLDFGTSDVTLYVGSLGYYFGNYWASLRGTYTPKELGSSASGLFTLRRYFSTADHYLNFSLGAGMSSDEYSFERIQLKSNKLELSYQKSWGVWIGSMGIDFSHTEVSPFLDRRQTGVKLDLKRVF